jgi:hypothetical protein
MSKMLKQNPGDLFFFKRHIVFFEDHIFLKVFSFKSKEWEAISNSNKIDGRTAYDSKCMEVSRESDWTERDIYKIFPLQKFLYVNSCPHHVSFLSEDFAEDI